MIKFALKYFIIRTKEIFHEGGATTVRSLLAVSSFLFILNLLFSNNLLSREEYQGLSFIFSETSLAIMLGFHFIGTMWRLYDTKSRVYLAFLINLYGVSLWTFIIGCVIIFVTTYTPGIYATVALIAASWVCLFGTGSNEGKGTP